jgi:3-phosphoinositide dependent protein kinase-1
MLDDVAQALADTDLADSDIGQMGPYGASGYDDDDLEDELSGAPTPPLPREIPSRLSSYELHDPDQLNYSRTNTCTRSTTSSLSLDPHRRADLASRATDHGYVDSGDETEASSIMERRRRIPPRPCAPPPQTPPPQEAQLLSRYRMQHRSDTPTSQLTVEESETNHGTSRPSSINVPPSDCPPAEKPATQNTTPSAPPRKRTPDDFIMERTLGEGSYSTVMLATEKETQRQFAIKILDKRHIVKEKKVKYVNIEKETLNKLHHPSIVRLYYTFQDVSSLYFVLELAPNGEMLAWIRKLGSFDVPCTQFYAAELLEAVAYMHSQGVVHRDLKPENILFDEKMHIKLTDFGTAKLFDPMGQPDDDRSGSFVGTAEYVSPELLTNKAATRSCDWWAFGCIVYQLLAGRPPFKAANEYLTFQKIIQLDYRFPSGFPDTARDLVEKLLVSRISH